MQREITIDPVTRIEGHGKVTIHLDERGEVADARFHVTQFRGFEKFCEGRPFHEMPSITARICGICPISHCLASAKACDALLAVRIPETAANLRRMLMLAQYVQSHALSFFHLSAPDLLLGMDSDPARRNVLGLAEADPARARDGIRLRKLGQEMIQLLSRKKIHPMWVVPGGVNEPLDADRRATMQAHVAESLEIAQRTTDWFMDIATSFKDEIAHFGNYRSMFMGQITPDGKLEHYDGPLRFKDAEGNVVVDQVAPEQYDQFIGEAVEPWSYLKFPYFKPQGYPEGFYRVGPLARLIVADACGTPRADDAWGRFREKVGGEELLRSSFHFHFARLVEILFSLEKIDAILSDDAILDPRVRAQAEPNSLEGVGISEAPRGTLIHHYRIDGHGAIQWLNLIIATGHNNLAINRGVHQVAKQFVKSDRLEEGMLNRVEAIVRVFDPCLSCSTHALGRMPLRLQLVGPAGELLDELQRDAE